MEQPKLKPKDWWYSSIAEKIYPQSERDKLLSNAKRGPTSPLDGRAKPAVKPPDRSPR
jgi:hypothetical protein